MERSNRTGFKQAQNKKADYHISFAEKGKEKRLKMSEHWLSGWDSIANYLKISISSAQTYRKKYGLPVYQPVPNGSPMASKEELDEWVRGAKGCKIAQNRIR